MQRRKRARRSAPAEYRQPHPAKYMSHRVRQAAVPQGRICRFLHLGRAMGELALSSASAGVSRWAKGDKPDLSQLLLTPANARRLAERLSAMREIGRAHV